MALEQKEAAKKSHEILVNFAKQIATTSAAILALFASLISGKIITLDGISAILLIFLFATFIICIVFTFWLMLSIAGIMDEITFPSAERHAKNAGKDASIYRTSIRFPLYLTIVSFITGLAFLLAIVFSAIC